MRNELYIPAGIREEVVGFGLNEDTYTRAKQFQKELQDTEEGEWNGSYQHPLETLVNTGDKRCEPTVYLEVESDRLQIMERSHDGPMPIRFYDASIEQEGVLFSSMLLYYVFEDGPTDTMTSEDVRAALQTRRAQRAWDTALAAARADPEEFSDAS